ncbi:F-box and leucine-rich protein 22 [Acipenser ruthenus]|uniref:F-box and leucine-rich protein 22 n=1 Tax=Acipenser ruthenus TaxID=7906 RepID=A0A444V3Z7_ACIRT|nr:F-box and leucine-rich protein 22-like [Acipenser ruthenus]RXM95139.1 F-box and leucine-rich protein 22 [Acipenser ruthenus]
MHITDLNRECLVHLFSFLDKESRKQFSETCHDLRQVFLDPALWTLLNFHSPSELKRDNFVLGSALRYLSVCWHSSRVKVCNIEDWVKTTFQKDICSKHESTVSDFLGKVRNKCPSLLSLTLSGCGHVTDHDVTLLLQSCPRLRILRLENCVRLTDCTLQALVRHGRSLQSVQVDFCRNVTQDGLRLVRERRPSLELTAERSGGMIPDSKPGEKLQLGRTLQKLLQYS